VDPIQAENFKKVERDAMALLGESFVVLADNGTPRKGSGAGGMQAGGTEASKSKSAGMATGAGGDASTDLDRKITALINVFEVASDKCQFDHPLCVECHRLVVLELDRRLQEVEEDQQM
jgi:hypothetical protein